MHCLSSYISKILRPYSLKYSGKLSLFLVGVILMDMRISKINIILLTKNLHKKSILLPPKMARKQKFYIKKYVLSWLDSIKQGLGKPHSIKSSSVGARSTLLQLNHI